MKENLDINYFYLLAIVSNLMITTFATRQIMYLALKKRILKVYQGASTVFTIGGPAIFTSFIIVTSLLNHWINLKCWHIILSTTIVLFFTGLRYDLVGLRRIKRFFIYTGSIILITGMRLGTNTLFNGTTTFNKSFKLLMSATIFFIILFIIENLKKVDRLFTILASSLFLIFGIVFALSKMVSLGVLNFGLVGNLAGYIKYQNKEKRIALGESGKILIGYLLGYNLLILLT